jgi:hypothetical protein
MSISLPDAKYSKPEQIRSFYQGLLDRVQSLPGVAGEGAVNLVPLSGLNASGTATIDTHAVPLEDTEPEVDDRG